MATARDLLEQADALMRRNRLRDAPGEDTAPTLPVLTEVVQPAGIRADRAPFRNAGDGGARSDSATGMATDAAGADASRAGGVAGAIDVDDVPVLTDVVADLEPISILGAPEDAGEPSRWPDLAASEASDDPWMADAPTGGRDGEAPAPFPFFADVADGRPAPPQADRASTDAPVRVAGDPARWEALAEEVRMQVLQRIDIFTDTGLQEQLTARLQPIVDRASADLVATINQQIGQLLRAYVAEAIEREIDKWRQDGA